MIIVGLGTVIAVIVCIFLFSIGFLNTFFLWIANNHEIFITIYIIMVLIKVCIYIIHENKIGNRIGNKIAIFLLCPLIHIPFVKFFLLLVDNVLNKTGLISVFLAPIGRIIAVGAMLTAILMTDVTFFKGGIMTEEEDNHVSDYVMVSVASIILSVITLAIYIYW